MFTEKKKVIIHHSPWHESSNLCPFAFSDEESHNGVSNCPPSLADKQHHRGLEWVNLSGEDKVNICINGNPYSDCSKVLARSTVLKVLKEKNQ